MAQDIQQQVYNKIVHHLQLQQYSEVEQICLFEISKRNAEDDKLYFYLGVAARFLNKNKAAIIALEAALRLQPKNPDYLQACASAYEAEKDFGRAFQLVSDALKLAPRNSKVLANHAVALERINRPDEALKQYQQVLEIDANDTTANINFGTLLHKLGFKKRALEHNRKAYSRLPHVFATLYNLIDTLIANFYYQEALECCTKALDWQPRHAHLLVKHAMTLSALSMPKEALVSLSLARVINPWVHKDLLPHTRNMPKDVGIYIDGYILQYEVRYFEQQACYWEYRKIYIEQLCSDFSGNAAANYAQRGKENGFRVLSLDINNEVRKALMSRISGAVSDFVWLFALPPFDYPRKDERRIRIGYLSPDFRFHATAVLMRQFFRIHDRGRFEVYAYSLFNEQQIDSYRQEIENKCDVFHDVSNMSVPQIAQLINNDCIDILIDLAGYTAHCRTEVMAMRPAPIQFQYLGFAATTMGADFIDYVIIDKQLCPDGKADEFTEQVIRLPHTIYPYDNDINHSPTTFKRAEFDLPEDVFVFCCLNSSYKIDPVVFESWINILKAVPNSVLWLLGKGLDVQDNLEREAEARGVGKSRLVFTGRVPLEQHLPRFQLADLFLDTYWHNAHTTGAEALWQGLPLITD